MKNFFTTLLAIFVALLIGTLLITGIIFLAVSKDSKPKVEKGSVLVLNLNKPISDREVSVNPQEFAQNLLTGGGVSSSFTLWELMHVIKHAAKDEKISGLYLTGSVPTGGTFYSGTATLREFREALATFKESGKPIFAYNDSYNMRSYYLASIADSVFMHPFGRMGITGFSTSRTFYKEAMDKFGVKFYVSRVGAYKSALEPYFRNEISAEDREQRTRIIENHYAQFADAISESRELTIERLHELSGSPRILRDANSVLDEGLIDRITYYDEVLAALRAFTNVEDASKPFTQVSYDNYLKFVGDAIYPKGKQNIAFFVAEGGIVGGSGTSDIAGDYTARQLRSIRNDDKIKAVVVRVNSPGGGVTPSEVILREMRLLAEVKPVVVSMGNVAASGGYWISSFADYIFANPTTVTGSIGVYSAFPVFDDIASEYGVSFDSIKSHPFSDMMTSDRSPTQEEWDIIHSSTLGIYDDFLDRVAEGRSMNKDAAHEMAQGRVWSGIDALELGLVDELGGTLDAIAKAAELAELDEWAVKRFERTDDFRTRLLRNFGASATTNYSNETQTAKFATELSRFFQVINQFNDPAGTYARLPLDFVIE